MRLEERERIEPRRIPAAVPSAVPSRAGASLRRKRTGWIWLIVLCAMGVGIYIAYRKHPDWINRVLSAEKQTAAKQGTRRVPVIVATARRGELPIYLDGIGGVTALNSVLIRSRVDGELIKVAFTEGQIVHEGDLLAEIDPRPYQAQLQQAEGQLAKDRAALNFAKLDWARYDAAPTSIVTQQQRDTSKAQVEQNEGLIKSDQAQIDAIKLQLTYCRITAPISGRVGLRMVDQGNLIHANDSTGLVSIAQIEPISVVFSLSEDVLPQVLHARDAGNPLEVQALNRDKTTRLATGTLLAIDNQVDPTTLMVKFKAQFENKQHTLFPNQAVFVRLLVDTRRDVVLVPVAAIQHTPDGAPFVYAAKLESAPRREPGAQHHEGSSGGEIEHAQSKRTESAGAVADRASEPRLEGTVDLRTVQTGPSEAGMIVVEQGLSAGEIVVIDGVDKLQPGSQITAHPARSAATQPVRSMTQPASAPGPSSNGKRRKSR